MRKAYYGKNNQRMIGTTRRAATKNATRYMKNSIPGVVGAIGGYYGGPMGRAAAQTVAKMAFQAGENFVNARRIKGRGDYIVGRGITSSEDFGAMGYRTRSALAASPKVEKLEKGEMRICHSEYIGELVSSGTTGTSNFVSQSYAINPANSGTFPWLSSTAINFQDYKFIKLVFEYRPLVSESTSTSAATLTSMGSVILATQYDSTLGPYINKNTMENSDFAISIKPSRKVLHAIECKPRFNPLGVLYTSGQGSLTQGANGSDIRMQNLGIFQIASCNIPIASNTALDLGEIWVHYEVELYKPQLNAGLSNIQSAHYSGNAATGSPATTTCFGPNITSSIQPTAIANNFMPLTFTTSAFTFPLQITEGNFLVTLYIRGSSVIVAGSYPTVVNGAILQCWNVGTLGQTDQALAAVSPQFTITATTMCYVFVVQVNAPGSSVCTVSIPTTTVPTGGQFDLVVTPYNTLML